MTGDGDSVVIPRQVREGVPVLLEGATAHERCGVEATDELAVSAVALLCYGVDLSMCSTASRRVSWMKWLTQESRTAPPSQSGCFPPKQSSSMGGTSTGSDSLRAKADRKSGGVGTRGPVRGDSGGRRI